MQQHTSDPFLKQKNILSQGTFTNITTAESMLNEEVAFSLKWP